VLLILLGILLAGVPVALIVLLRRYLRRHCTVSARTTSLMLAAGSVVGGGAAYLEQLVLAVTGLSLLASQAGAGGAMLAMFLFAAPLGEALKVAVVWPLYRSRTVITGPVPGLFLAASAAAGFAVARVVGTVAFAPLDMLQVARLALGIPGHIFFAGVWGYALGSGKGARGRWFSLAWLAATLLHGLYDHIVIGRGPGLLVAALPLLLAMTLAAWLVLRGTEPAPDSMPHSAIAAALLPTLPDSPSSGAVRRALRRQNRPVMVHWIAISTLVTTGVMFTALAAAVFVGHQVGVDFAVAGEDDVRAGGPLLLLGVAFLSAFPVAGFLVARASAATSVLEPALGAAVAILAVVALVSMAAPVSVILALAVAPIAFALACFGAWFGLGR
jgi:hypothetical protein